MLSGSTGVHPPESLRRSCVHTWVLKYSFGWQAANELDHPACMLQAAVGSTKCCSLPGGHDYFTSLGLQMLRKDRVVGRPEDSQEAHAGHKCGDGAMQVSLIVDLG